jgi:2-dehydropantoate 2-reductase
LSEGGADVRLISRSKAHVDAINSDGLTVIGPRGERRVRMTAMTSCASGDSADLLIVLVKSYDTKAAILDARTLIAEHTAVLSLQNGLGHEEILAEAIGHQHVLAGKTYVGGVLVAPGRVISGIENKRTYIGELDGSRSDRVMAVAEVFNRADLLTTVSTDIMSTMWDKLLVNVATGALSGITRLPYGALYEVPEVRSVALAAVAEAMTVARAAGIKLEFTDAEQPWIRAAEGLPPEFKASMLQSLEKSSRTEIDYINGAVVRWGERFGIPTPVNQALVGCIKGIEKGLPNQQAKANA